MGDGDDDQGDEEPEQLASVDRWERGTRVR
jgi:hypothetical protein